MFLAIQKILMSSSGFNSRYALLSSYYDTPMSIMFDGLVKSSQYPLTLHLFSKPLRMKKSLYESVDFPFSISAVRVFSFKKKRSNWTFVLLLLFFRWTD